LESLQRELATGHPVELIDACGPPSWYQVRLRQRGAALWEDRNQPFTLYSADAFLVELFRDPPVPAYRFRAEVHHVESIAGRPLGVGIYFLHSGPETDPDQHWFATLTFNNMVKSPLPEGNPVQFEIHHVFGPPASPWVHAHQFPNKPHLAYFGHTRVEDWHQLAVEITASEVVLEWDRGPRQTFTYQELNEVGASLQRRQAKTNPAIIPPLLGPRTAMGIFVSGGKAAFRHVVVEPLHRE
jgi:hypothetical protein